MKSELWIARDEDGLLHLFTKKPVRREKTKIIVDGKEIMIWVAQQSIEIDKSQFQELTFYDEPQRVKLEIVWERKFDIELFILLFIPGLGCISLIVYLILSVFSWIIS